VSKDFLEYGEVTVVVCEIGASKDMYIYGYQTGLAGFLSGNAPELRYFTLVLRALLFTHLIVSPCKMK